MNTVAQNVNEMAAAVAVALDSLKAYSAIHHEPGGPLPGSLVPGPFGTVRRTGGAYMIGYSAWVGLSPEGVQAQTAALDVCRRFEAVGRSLLRGSPDKVLETYDTACQTVLRAIQQTTEPDRSAVDSAFASACEAIALQVGIVANLYDATAGDAIFVPDTNALLYNPAVEDWAIDGAARFTLYLLPTVLRELDRQKINHRVEAVRDKAEGLIRRLKGYRGRGRLLDGVPLRKDVSTLVAWALEPDVVNALPWLDPSNDDDRILAGVIEVMRRRPHSPVVLITRDINLQTKAEFAGVPYDEPPDLPSPSGA